MSSRMTADQIASQFYSQKPRSERWLTQKQTAWLMNTFRRETPGFERGMGDTAAGVLYVGDDEIGAWEMVVSHLNGCGLFKVSLYADTAPMPAPLSASERERIEGIKASIAALRQAKATAIEEGKPTEIIDLHLDILFGQLG